MGWEMLFWQSNSCFDIRSESENRIMTFEILFWHSNWVRKFYFDIQNPNFTFDLSRKIVFWHSKSYFDIRTESENAILIFKILFRDSNWVGKFVIWHSISHFHIRTQSENCIMIFKFRFWHSTSVGKSYFEIQNPILSLKLSRKSYFLCGGVYCFHVVHPPIRPSVRPSACSSAVTLFFSIILKMQWWIFINFCRHIDINKVHPYKEKKGLGANSLRVIALCKTFLMH